MPANVAAPVSAQAARGMVTMKIDRPAQKRGAERLLWPLVIVVVLAAGAGLFVMRPALFPGHQGRYGSVGNRDERTRHRTDAEWLGIGRSHDELGERRDAGRRPGAIPRAAGRSCW